LKIKISIKADQFENSAFYFNGQRHRLVSKLSTLTDTFLSTNLLISVSLKTIKKLSIPTIFTLGHVGRKRYGTISWPGYAAIHAN